MPWLHLLPSHKWWKKRVHIARLKGNILQKRATKALCTTGHKNVAGTTNLFPLKMGLERKNNYEKEIPLKIGQETFHITITQNIWIPLSKPEIILPWNTCPKVTLVTLDFQTTIYDTKTTKSKPSLNFFQALLGEYTMESQPIRLILVDWFVFHFIFEVIFHFFKFFFWGRLPFFVCLFLRLSSIFWGHHSSFSTTTKLGRINNFFWGCLPF